MRLTARVLDVSNAFQNTNVPIHERVCVSPPPYYLDWFKRSYLRKVTVLMHGNLLHTTVQMGVLRLKVLILINHTVKWHMLTHSELTFLLHLCIYSLQEF